MNSYLKEVAAIAGVQMAGFVTDELNTHKARRTFASTVALKNGVPIHIVKEILGHSSVTQTEEYAITEQESIAQEMQGLKIKLEEKEKPNIEVISEEIKALMEKLQEKQTQMKQLLGQVHA